MAGRQVTQTIKFNFEGDISNLRGSIGQIEQKMQNIKLPKIAEKGINSDLQKLKTELSKLESKTKGGIIKLDDTGSIQKSGERIKELYTSLTNKVKDLGNVSDKELRNLFPPEIVQKIDNARAAMDKYEKEIKEANAELKKQEKELERLQGIRDKKKTELKTAGSKKKITDQEYDDLTRQKKYQQGQSTRAKNQMDSMRAQYSKLAEKAGINKDGTINKRSLSDEDKQFAKTYEDLATRAQKATAEVEKLNKKINESIKISKYNELEKEFKESEQQAKEAGYAVDNLKNKINQNFTNFKGSLDLGIDPSKLQDIKAVEAAINGIGTEEVDRLRQGFDGLGREVDELESKVSDTGDKISGEFSQAANSAMSMQNQFNQLSQNIQYFFGISNAIQLFKRTVREAFGSVKELDSAMKEIAVVSDYDISDMWGSLPQFTKQANQLGVAITEVYDATGLYVQQGLDLVESQGLANETLKMAKIAGMDAAAATDAMTSALRGFNMELNQGSAEKVNDIYSKLAAITASDTQEIATAMSKTASIASNAGATIENTSAFLSMIIETTRESAETAGTALKTVIARFSELKKSPAEIGDVDGEIVDANQIESALRLAGVDLRDATGQFRNFDEVIIELSGKWDSLDKNTQRYIATMAAGSRQQSRFLALMSDNERLLQLTDAAYNSAGASTSQFNKTLDTMESKLNQLKNAWDTFTQNLMNSELIKVGIDLLTGILTAINGITNAFSQMGPVIGTVLSTTIIAAFFTLAKKGVNALLTGAANGIGQFGTKIQTKMQEITNQSAINGANAGKQYATKFVKNAEPRFKTWYTKQQNKINSNNIPFGPPTARENFKLKYGQDFTEYSQLQIGKGKNKKIYTKTEHGNYAVSDYKGDPTDNPIITAKQMEKELTNGAKPAIRDYEKLGMTISKVGGAMMGLGVASSLVAQELRKAGNEKAAEGFEKFGAILTSFGSIITMIGPMLPQLVEKFKNFNEASFKSMSKWIIIIAIIGTVITIVKELIALFNRNSLEGQLTNITKQTEKAAEAAQKAQEAYSNWLSDKNEYTGLLEALKETTEGTEAWLEEMDKIQDKVYELINTYPELAQYIKEDGTISDEGLNILDDRLKKQKQLAISNKVGVDIAKNELQYQKDVRDLEKEQKNNKDPKKDEDYFKKRREELDTDFNKTYQGNLNYLMQNIGIEGYMADNISAAMVKNNTHTHGQNIISSINKNKSSYGGAQAANNIGFVAGGGAAAAMVPIVAGATKMAVAAGAEAAASGLAAKAVSGAVLTALKGGLTMIPGAGWAILGGVAIAGIAAGIIGAVKKNAEKKEIQEAYAKMLGVSVEDLDEDIKNDIDTMTAELAAYEQNKRIEQLSIRTEYEIISLGDMAQDLFQNDLSLLDEDFSKYGGFEAWIESLKEGVNELTKLSIEDAAEKFIAESEKVSKSMDRIFGGKANMKGKNKAFNISAAKAQQLSMTEEKLREELGDNIVNTLNSTMSSQSSTQLVVDELSSAYIRLGEAATTTQKALVAQEMFESANENLKTFGATLMVVGNQTFSATNQIKDFYMNLSSDQMNELFKNGKLTAQSVMEMGDSFTDLEGIVDTTGINFATLADVLSDVKSGVIEVDDLTQGFVETLDELSKAQHILEDSMAAAANFKAPTSGTAYGEKAGEVAQTLIDLISEGRYGDLGIIEGNFDFLFGEDAWEKELQKAGYNAKAALSKFKDELSIMTEETNFFELWKDTAEKSNGLWSVGADGVSIDFNLKDISNTDDLIDRIEEITGWSEEFIQKALADAEIWSNDLMTSLRKLDATSSLNKLLQNQEKIDIDGILGVNLDVSQLEAFYNTAFEGLDTYFTTFDEFYSYIKTKYDNEGIIVKEKRSGNFGDADKLKSDFMSNHSYSGYHEGYYFGGVQGTYVNPKLNLTMEEGKEAVRQDFSYDYFNKTLSTNLPDYWNSMSEEEKQSEYNKVFESYFTKWSKTKVTRYDTLSKSAYTYQSTNDSFDIETAKTDLNEYLSNLVDLYIKQGFSTTEAIEKVKDEYSSYSSIAGLFDFQGNATNAVNALEKVVFGKDAVNDVNYTWDDRALTEEEAQLIRQANEINEGTMKAIQYLLDKTGLAKKKNEGISPDDDKYKTEGQKLLEENGIQQPSQDNSNGNNNNGNGNNKSPTPEQDELFKTQAKNTANAYSLVLEDLKNKYKQIDFDWLHNLNQLAERAVHNLEKLEKEYERDLNLRNKTTEELTKNLISQYEEMFKSKEISNATIKHAGDRLQGMVDNNSELEPYVYRDENNKIVRINYDEINKVKNDENLSSKIKELLDEMLSLDGVIKENEQNSLDQELKMNEFLENINNNIIDFENQVKDMVISEYEKEIDKLSQIDSSINDANSKLINSIQNSLNRYRQERDNKKTEQSLTDMQNRLALLRADTSGANRQEIMELEKELGEAQEDYTDTLIDQKISTLQEQNEEASAQRQEQIEIANAQLKSAQDNGLINKHVEELLGGGFEKGSALYTLWEGVNSKGMTKEEWDTALKGFQKDFTNYSAGSAFREAYVGEDGSINKDLEDRLATIMPDLSAEALDILSAIGGYAVQSDNDLFDEATIQSQRWTEKDWDAKLGGVSQSLMNEHVIQKDFGGQTWYQVDDKYWVNKSQSKLNHQSINMDGYKQFWEWLDINPGAQLLTFDEIKKKYENSKYATGGLNTQTGPAWLDGTPSKPELVLNSTDTQNFLQLKDILSDIMRGGSFTTNQKDGDLNLEIYLNVEQGISSDYDVEQLVNKVKQEIVRVGTERNIQILTKR